jgi:transcriptional regulator with XRE-family HTH domain
MGIENRLRANLRRYIERSGYSISAVGHMSGAGQENLTRFLRGDTQKMGTDKLEQIANFLHIDIWRLFEPEDKPIPTAAQHTLNMVSERLESKDLRILIQTAQALADEKKTPTSP